MLAMLGKKIKNRAKSSSALKTLISLAPFNPELITPASQTQTTQNGLSSPSKPKLMSLTPLDRNLNSQFATTKV